MNEQIARLVEDYLPEHMHDGLRLYLEHGIEPGGFLRAVLENDLCGAAARADSVNRSRLADYATVLSALPMSAWGSRERVNGWMAEFARRED